MCLGSVTALTGSIPRYISQVRQEIAIRLHARLYPGGVGPSKVSASSEIAGRSSLRKLAVLAEFHKEKVYGEEPVDDARIYYTLYFLSKIQRMKWNCDTPPSSLCVAGLQDGIIILVHGEHIAFHTEVDAISTSDPLFVVAVLVTFRRFRKAPAA